MSVTDDQYRDTLTTLATAALDRAQDGLVKLCALTAENEDYHAALLAGRASADVGAALDALRATRLSPEPAAVSDGDAERAARAARPANDSPATGPTP